MKILNYLSSVLCLIVWLTACDSAEVNDKEEQSPENTEMTWKLVKMTGNMQGSERTGSEMEYQESYSFSDDNTFTKERSHEGKVKEAKGKYEKVEKNGEKYFELTFDGDSELIGNCTGDNKEFLYFQSENTISSSWSACDGPGLIYELQ
ncbi:hypothetical protein [Fulvivirga sediminis]|uniref:Lipocalin-like domain-containing protein n=1 Tax=Fulvivirga sediminis TaxID=2803949 RepID=A0A937JZ23_9BACT|nr:hypothetical protein [Fulvivirga sediminis]MBL3654731.1 hypothetical protein [Fulvivirga sediminis]